MLRVAGRRIANRKPKSLGIRSLLTTVLLVYGVLALLAVLFNMPHKWVFAHWVQPFVGFLVAEKLLSALSQSGQTGLQLTPQWLQVFARLAF